MLPRKHANDRDPATKHTSTRPAAGNTESVTRPTTTGEPIRKVEFHHVSLTPRNIFQLQRTVGNRAVNRIFNGLPLQRAGQARAESGGGTDAEHSALSQSAAGLPASLKAGVENLSGLSMDDVTVHYNSSEPAKIDAAAYTRGSEIHLGPNQEQHLAHEAWHVVQQKQGRVRPTIQAAGVPVNDSQELEKEADEMGARATGLQLSGGRDTAAGVPQFGHARERDGSGLAASALQKFCATPHASYAHPAAKGAGGMDARAHTPAQRTAAVPPALGMRDGYGPHSSGVVQRIALSNVPHMDPGGSWTPTTDANGRAQKIVATNLKLAPGYNSVPSGSFNAPSVDPRSWQTLHGWNLVGGPPHYRRMHLLNDRLGGPGNDTRNLAPGTASLNSSHSSHFESPAMTDVLNQGLTITYYEVRIAYNPPSANLTSVAGKAAWEDTIWEIWGQFTYTDANNLKQAGHYNAEEDTPGLDTQANWVGH